MVVITPGTQIGADGLRHPAGTQPTNAAEYAEQLVRVQGQPQDGEVPTWDEDTGTYVWGTGGGGGPSDDEVRTLVNARLAEAADAWDTPEEVAAGLTDHESRLAALEAGGGGGGALVTLDDVATFDAVYGGPDLGFDQEFDAVASALPAGWVWANQPGTAAYREEAGAGILTDGPHGDNLAVFATSLAGAPAQWVAIGKLTVSGQGSSFMSGGMYLRDSASAHLTTICTLPSQALLNLEYWNSFGSFNSTGPQNNAPMGRSMTYYAKVIRHAVNSWDFLWSTDGRSWIGLGIGIDPWGSPAYDQVGFGCNALGAIVVAADWFRLRELV